LKKSEETEVPKKDKIVVCSGKQLCKKEDCLHRVHHRMEGCNKLGVYICKTCDQAVKCKEVKEFKKVEEIKVDPEVKDTPK
jgi:hypothetical protein